MAVKYESKKCRTIQPVCVKQRLISIRYDIVRRLSTWFTLTLPKLYKERTLYELHDKQNGKAK